MSAGFHIRQRVAGDEEAAIVLSRTVYPWDPYTARELRSQLSVFPEGQFIAVANTGEILGLSMAMIVPNVLCERPHTWAEMTSDGMITGHDGKGGDVLYGVDTIVHPDASGRGIGTALIDARIMLARKLGIRTLRGFTRLPGYALHHDQMPFEVYADDVLAERRTEPALLMLKKCGFRIRDVVKGYVSNDHIGPGHAAVMVLELDTTTLKP